MNNAHRSHRTIRTIHLSHGMISLIFIIKLNKSITFWMDCGGCITILANLIDMYQIRKLSCKRQYMISEAKYPTNIKCFSLFTRRIILNWKRPNLIYTQLSVIFWNISKLFFLFHFYVSFRPLWGYASIALLKHTIFCVMSTFNIFLLS